MASRCLPSVERRPPRRDDHMNLGMPELLGVLVLLLIGFGVYWLIRLAVTHGVRAANERGRQPDDM